MTPRKGKGSRPRLNAKEKKLRAAYISWPKGKKPNLTALAKQFGVHRNTVRRLARDCGWDTDRCSYVPIMVQKADEKLAEKQAEANARTLKTMGDMDRTQEVMAENLVAIIEEIAGMPPSKKRRGQLLGFMGLKSVQAFLGGYKGLDSNARARQLIGGKPDNRTEMTFPPGQAAILKRALAALPDDEEIKEASE